MVADVEKLEKLDASEIDARRLNAKEVLMPKHGKKIRILCWSSQVGRERSGIPKTGTSCTRKGAQR